MEIENDFCIFTKKMKARIKYSEVLKQVIAMIVIPVLLMGIFLFGFSLADKFDFSKTLKDILLYVVIFASIGCSVLLILKIIMVDGEIEYDARGIHFHLHKKSFLFPHDDFFINYQNISNASLGDDESGRTAATIKIKSPNKTIVISPDSIENTNSFIDFWTNLEKQFSSFNSSNEDHPALLIQKKGFYESGFIKFLAYFALISSILLLVLKFINPDIVSTWKLIGFYCYALPFMLMVFKSNKNSNYKEK